MVTLQISNIRTAEAFREVSGCVGFNRLYRKGTDPDWYADYLERSEAQMAIVTLGYVPGVRARIMGDS